MKFKVKKEELDNLILSTHILPADDRHELIEVLPNEIELEGKPIYEITKEQAQERVKCQCVLGCPMNHREKPKKIEHLGIPPNGIEVVNKINEIIDKVNKEI